MVSEALGRLVGRKLEGHRQAAAATWACSVTCLGLAMLGAAVALVVVSVCATDALLLM